MVGVVGDERWRFLLGPDPEVDATTSGDEDHDEEGDEDGEQELGLIFDLDADLETKKFHLWHDGGNHDNFNYYCAGMGEIENVALSTRFNYMEQYFSCNVYSSCKIPLFKVKMDKIYGAVWE